MTEAMQKFIKFLESNKEDRAMLADLRRSLGTQNAYIWRYTMPFIPENTYPETEESYYLVAALFGLHPLSQSDGNMGTHLRQVANRAVDDAATTRRFTQLLNLQRASLDVPLRQHISILKSKDIAVNWYQLLYDLSHWSHPDHFVQKQWAGGYWPSKKTKSKS